MNSNISTVKELGTRPSIETVEESTLVESMDFSGAQAFLNDYDTPDVTVGSTNHSGKQICDRPELFDKYV